MKLNIICLTIFLLAATASIMYAVADTGSSDATASVSPQDLQAFVEKAATYAQENGKDKALAEFNNKSGQFVNGQLYIFANDFNNVCHAHPMKPALVGKDQTDLKDVNGVYFIKNMNLIAQSGSGFTYYIFANPADDNKDELKLVYVKKIDDNWYIGSGIYLPGKI